jgi:hypothetical protein
METDRERKTKLIFAAKIISVFSVADIIKLLIFMEVLFSSFHQNSIQKP